MEETQPLKEVEQAPSYTFEYSQAEPIPEPRRYPMMMECPYCQNATETVTEYKSGTVTYIACWIFCVFGFCCCCCLYPFCFDNLKDVVHYCSKCHKEIARAPATAIKN
jgi:hypothetical protein